MGVAGFIQGRIHHLVGLFQAIRQLRTTKRPLSGLFIRSFSSSPSKPRVSTGIFFFDSIGSAGLDRLGDCPKPHFETLVVGRVADSEMGITLTEDRPWDRDHIVIE